MSDQDKQPETQQQPQQMPEPTPSPGEPVESSAVAEKTVPAATPEAAKPESARPVAQPAGAGGTPAVPGADAKPVPAPQGTDVKPVAAATVVDPATAPAAPKPPAPAAPPKPAAPAKAPLEVSAGGKALLEAIKGAKIGLDEPKPDSYGNPIFDVPPEKLVDAGKALREKLGITFLSCLAPVDWPDRWEVVIHLYDFSHKTWLGLKTKIPKDQLKVPSVASIWPAADWYEREGYDMYGIEFEGHPHLCRILMADDWPTFPLRKDHPMDMEGGY